MRALWLGQRPDRHDTLADAVPLPGLPDAFFSLKTGTVMQSSKFGRSSRSTFWPPGSRGNPSKVESAVERDTP